MSTINTVHKFAFFAVPKTGSQSVDVTLRNAFEGWDSALNRQGHMSAAQAQEWYGTQYDDYYRFAVIRNVFDRFESAYRHIVRGLLTKNESVPSLPALACSLGTTDLGRVVLRPQTEFFTGGAPVDLWPYPEINERFAAWTESTGKRVSLPWYNRGEPACTVWTEEAVRCVEEYYADDLACEAIASLPRLRL